MKDIPNSHAKKFNTLADLVEREAQFETAENTAESPWANESTFNKEFYDLANLYAEDVGISQEDAIKGLAAGYAMFMKDILNDTMEVELYSQNEDFVDLTAAGLNEETPGYVILPVDQFMNQEDVDRAFEYMKN